MNAAPFVDARVWRRRFFILLAGLLALRLCYLACAQLDLAPDEAYYWEWSRRLDIGYYSKPPLIAWINALSTGLLGSTTFVVRLPAALLSCAALYGVFALGRALYDDRVGFWAAVASAATPGHAALGTIMTIDAPLVACWCWALALLARALQSRRVGWWAAVGVLVGVGTLAKFMMPVFLLAAWVYLAVEPRARVWLFRPGPWLMTGIALVAWLPVIGWNARNHWITLLHTGHHFRAESGLVDRLGTFVESAGYQMLAASPATWLLVLVLSAALIVRWRCLDARVRLLLLFGGVPLLMALLWGLRQRVNANWPAVFYPAAMVLLAAWAMARVEVAPWLDRRRRGFAAAVVVGVGFAILTLALPVIGPLLPWDMTRLRPVAELNGWRALAAHVDRLYAQTARPEETFLLAVRRQLASELAFYAAGQPIVYCWPQAGQIESQYDLWPGAHDKLGWDALIVLHSADLPPDLVSHFARVEPAETLEVPLGRRGWRVVYAYWGRGLRGWPTSSR